MANRLPSGQWRPRISNPRSGKQINPSTIIGGPDTYPTQAEAEQAEQAGRDALREHHRSGISVGDWWTEWTTEPLWRRPSEATMLTYRELTRGFALAHWDTPIRRVDDAHVRRWLQGPRRRSSVEHLRVMWNDAATAAAGRLVDLNPWAKLGLPSSRGRRDKQPPTQEAMARLVGLADELTPPSFAAYLDVAVHEGMRPGELDALRWSKVDFDTGTILIDEQWNAKTRTFELPKHHHARTVALTDPARARLQSLPVESEFCFTTLRGSHYRPTSRVYHWDRVRCTAGLGGVELYLATRHYFGWYAMNVLELPPHVIALQFGHQDGGELVRRRYGHPDERLARDRVRDAYRQAPAAPVPLRQRRAS